MKEQHMFPLGQLASVLSYDEPFLLPLSKMSLDRAERVFHLERLFSFLQRDFQGGLHSPLFTRPPIIYFQLRCFRPIDRSIHWEGSVGYPRFLGDRQRAIIGRGSAVKYLEERRARVTIRVRGSSQELFSIVILADEDMSPNREDWYRTPEGKGIQYNWARSGLKPCGRGTAITHYMFEISRVVERSLDACSQALGSISALVHVKVSSDDTKEHSLCF